MLTIDRVFICLLISSHIYCILGSFNVALNKPTWQSSTYAGDVSSRAVDGNNNQYYSGGSCAITQNHINYNWWCVDLKQSFDISSVKIFNRADDGINWMKGFEVRLSSTSHCGEAGFTSASPCYKDHTSTAQSVYTVNRCNQPSVPSLSARFVFVSIQREYLSICELQIFTENCPDGFYGTNCNIRCPANCTNNICGKMIGSCSNGCQGDLYGSRCEFACSTRCKNGKCNARTGTCTGCKDGSYGDVCEFACSTNCQDDKCDRKTGKCTGCKDGYYGDLCEESCPTCNGSCRQLDGVCLTGCKDGYWGCNGLCLQTCSYCNTGGCRIEDGVCHNGCQVGVNNTKCFNSPT
ncbi:multiple epidermal growth factor-like domains protein 6 isoform X1 [Patella vulgata]|uniref:multiple epidermal growth factor-like domains protein 6 isoform X1 n=1 Tax=Patella vulgata TaxID=6465 RepID=UPI00217F9307|nr:multiple epidermal growth factor-like domains protein 6 isoform X1 [Patella vulgata]